MTALMERLANIEQDDAVLPVALMPEAADQLMLLEDQLRHVPTDRRSILMDEKSRLLDQLCGERPGKTLINNIVWLSQLYDGRAAERQLEDGSTLRSWGTRDKDGQYLSHRYYVQQNTDGTLSYRVLTLDESGRKYFEIDDQGSVSVMVKPFAKYQRDFAPFRPTHMSEHASDAAIKELFDASATSKDIVTARKDSSEKQKADISALGMLDAGPLEAQLAMAQDSSDIDAIFDDYMAEKPIPYHMLRVLPLTRVA
jgi:hypothetical protein